MNPFTFACFLLTTCAVVYFLSMTFNKEDSPSSNHLIAKESRAEVIAGRSENLPPESTAESPRSAYSIGTSLRWTMSTSPSNNDAVSPLKNSIGTTPASTSVASFSRRVQQVAPTKAPTTTAPTRAPTTTAPTKAPTTTAPTKAPTTRAPTRAPTTTAPTKAPTTRAPTRAPTTGAPTRAPTTRAPTQAPTTRAPTQAPTTRAPTQAPTKAPTIAPTLRPTTSVPTSTPTTVPPTKSPTTLSPTSAPTSDPTSTPTTSQPTESPTTLNPTTTPVTTTSPIPIQSLGCPVAGSSFSFTFEGPMKFFITDSDILCTLVQVSPDGEHFKPLGRSYHGYNWEASSGEFSTLTWTCSADSCLVSLPSLPIGSIYQLTTFEGGEMNLTKSDEVARFLEQATFGATSADIASMDTVFSSPLRSFASWIENQQKVVPMTSHREMFRIHMNERMEIATQVGAVTHPCQKGTRYRRSAFSSLDQTKFMNITTVGSKKILTVDGFVRTVVDGPVAYFSKPSVVWSDGRYEITRGTHIADMLGARFQLFNPTANTKWYEVAFNGTYGNPVIRFDSSINATPNVLVYLSLANAQLIDEKYFKNQVSRTTSKTIPTTLIPSAQELILTEDLSDAVCASIGEPGNPINPVFALFNGSYWIHDPRFETITNTVESPSPDGGGQVIRDTFNIVETDRNAVCANVPRTFLNEDSCVFSEAATACAAESYDPFKTLRTQLRVEVSPKTIRDIYTITGNGTIDAPTRYVYAVDGLRIQHDNSVATPCQRFKTSRWIPITCTGAAAGVNGTVHSIFSSLLFASKDSNTLVRDVNNNSTTLCPVEFASLVGFEIQDQSGKCWKNVHPDHLNVFDFTFWTRLDTHPGNSINRNPIKEFAEAGKTTLTFPSWHDLTKWSANKNKFGYVGRLGDNVDYYALPRELRTTALNEYYGFTPEAMAFPNSTGALVCGSPFEVSNNPALGGSRRRGAFGSLNRDFAVPFESDYFKQKRMIWTETALTAKDQLRQRTAWALAQILVVSPDSIDEGFFETESMTAYYDIFTRNAFGNYRDVLKEVSYSPLMAEMLSYVNSKSLWHTLRYNKRIEYPDENFAREIMQLFSIGLVKLNPDGSHVVDNKGETVRAYTNDDIVEYARVWTGFVRRGRRGNIEDVDTSNRIDPMKVIVDHRDIYPKMGLDRKYIGDDYPLCADLPAKHFLKAGATYRLLGRSSTPELQYDPIAWASDTFAKRLKLQSIGGSSLRSKLCGSQNTENCNLAPKVVLDENLECSGGECSVDTVRVVEVSDGIFYEYVRTPCVYQAFFENPKLVVPRNSWSEVACADPRTHVASVACCTRMSNGAYSSNWTDVYWGERATFASAIRRCNNNLCNRSPRPSCNREQFPLLGSLCSSEYSFWTLTTCTLRVKIDELGNVALVHSPTGIPPQDVSRRVQNDTKTFFRVDWSGNVESLISNCTATPSCRLAIDGACLCDVYVTNEQVFFDGSGDRPNREKVLSSLKIGAFNPALSGSNLTASKMDGVNTYTVDGHLTSASIFEVIDNYGVRQLRKNAQSTVHIIGHNVSFRNPVHFIHISDGATHEAQDETEAALDHYFYHPNTAPFLALRFAQRFGISNPSPGFISRIASAFRDGSYVFTDQGGTFEYGSGKYGDIGAMVACILLDREARTSLLDADPTHGSLKEPLIKLLGMMRAFEFRPTDDAGFIDFDDNIATKIGQMAHAIPNVFSFFLPEYKPAGPVAQATLVAPEAQVITGPRTVDFMNGVLSLIKYGLSPCFGGFGAEVPGVTVPCQNYVAGKENSGIKGKLTFSPKSATSPDAIVSELATLLTSGRLSTSSRAFVAQVIRSEPNRTMGVLKAQQLMVLAPEFHSTNIARKSGKSRPDSEVNPPSMKPYKAVVYVLLSGGMDSFNMLAPHTCSVKNEANQSLLEQYYAMRGAVAITNDERSRIINATGQACDQFVVHQDLEIVERLYKEGDLAFFANAGVLNRPSTRENYNSQSRTPLFAHNFMQEEAQKVDPFDRAFGTGVLGRMCEALHKKGYSAQPITIEDASIATIGSPGSASGDPLIVSPYGTRAFLSLPNGETFDPRPYLHALNNATTLQSSVYGETWSKGLHSALLDNAAFLQMLSTTQVTTTFPATDYGAKLKMVSTLIASHEQRRTDREVFFVDLHGWDHHSDLKGSLSKGFQQLNGALSAFHQEMKVKGYWDSVSLVITTDFARTLTPNSSNGTDHAWGGNYFVMGGAVNGGQIHGEYPSDITENGPYSIGRGRFIPSMSWESVLNPIAQWMGVETEQELNYCLPNRLFTGTELFQKEEVFMA